jgi:DNA-binding response OmpR family regulator
LLLVEDEREILENSRAFFEKNGYRALTAATVAAARERLAEETPGAVVLDIMLLDGNGLDLLAELWAAGNRIPVIMLTAWGKAADKIRGLRLGANDYMAKPFDYGELLARVETMFRNVEQLPETITKDPFTLRLMTREAFVNGRDLLLTPKDYSLLLFFLQNENLLLSNRRIYETVWGQPLLGDIKAVSNAVTRLRQKLAGSGYTISTEYGVGYRFERGGKA